MCLVEVIMVGIGLEKKMKDINKFLLEYDHKEIRCVKKAGGRLVMKSDILIGAFDNLNVDNFVTLLEEQQWTNSFQIIIKEKDDKIFTTYEFGGICPFCKTRKTQKDMFYETEGNCELCSVAL